MNSIMLLYMYLKHEVLKHEPTISKHIQDYQTNKFRQLNWSY